MSEGVELGLAGRMRCSGMENRDVECGSWSVYIFESGLGMPKTVAGEYTGDEARRRTNTVEMSGKVGGR